MHLQQLDDATDVHKTSEAGWRRFHIGEEYYSATVVVTSHASASHVH